MGATAETPASSGPARNSRSPVGRRRRGIVALSAVPLVLAVLAGAAGCGGGGGGERSPGHSFTETRVFFSSGADRMFGILALPTGEGPHPALVLLSGSDRGGVDTELLATHAHRLASAGFAVLRYDPPGVGRSGGTRGFETLDDRAREAIAAAELLRSQRDIRRDEVGLWGESQGGWVTQMAAAASPAIAFIVSVSGSGVSLAHHHHPQAHPHPAVGAVSLPGRHLPPRARGDPTAARREGTLRRRAVAPRRPTPVPPARPLPRARVLRRERHGGSRKAERRPLPPVPPPGGKRERHHRRRSPRRPFAQRLPGRLLEDAHRLAHAPHRRVKPKPRNTRPIVPTRSSRAAPQAACFARARAATCSLRYLASSATKPSSAEPRVCCQVKPRK
jgi:pimeloyl-ACP methyl ester carboxylesterase